jgi:hypothetical protein
MAAGEITRDEITHAIEAFSRLSEDEYVETMRRGEKAMTPDVAESLRKSQEDIDRQTIGICSLTELGSSPFMSWNYADRHTGLCIEFSTAHSPFDRAVPVSYQAVPPVLKAMGEPYAQQVARMQTKGTAWEHEKEWRIFTYPSEGPVLKFSPACLLSVSLCEKIERETEVLRILAERNTRASAIQVYRFTANRNSYDYERIPIHV